LYPQNRACNTLIPDLFLPSESGIGSAFNEQAAGRYAAIGQHLPHAEKSRPVVVYTDQPVQCAPMPHGVTVAKVIGFFISQDCRWHRRQPGIDGQQ
jgi:hypothetical protein